MGEIGGMIGGLSVGAPKLLGSQRIELFRFRAHVGALWQDDTLFVANFHKVRTVLEAVPNLQSLFQQRRWVMETDYLMLRRNRVSMLL
jgi:hypothetical protein